MGYAVVPIREYIIQGFQTDMKKRMYYTVTLCDYCGERAIESGCFLCGKDVCSKHSVGVTGFYDRTICVKHVQDGDYEKALMGD